jgi:predicted MFS family arabinose efflux permease
MEGPAGRATGPIADADDGPRIDRLTGRVAAASDAVCQVLRNPDIRLLETGWTIGVAADWALLVTALVAAYAAGGAPAVGLLGLVRMLPSAAVALFMPVPRTMTRDRVILAINVVRTVGAAAAAATLFLGWPIVVLFAAVSLVGSAGALVRPNQTDLLPALARTPDELIASNVASSTGEGLGTLAGPVVGGLLVTVAGGGPTAAVAALGFGAAAIAVAGIRVHGSRDIGAEVRPRRPPVADAVAAFREMPPAAVLIASFAAQLLTRGLLTTLIVVASIELLGLGEPGVGWLNAAIGGGGLLGAAVALGLTGSGRLAPSVAVSLAGWGLPIAVIGVLPHPAVALLALVVVGVSNATLDIAGFTLLQRALPRHSRPPVFAMIEAASGVTVAAGAILAPVLVEVVGIQGALAVTGAILPITAALGWRWIARLDREAELPERELRLLRGIPMFGLLPLDTIDRVARSLVPVPVARGDVLMREGEPGDRYLIVADGSLDVRQQGRLLRSSVPGSGVGEIALLRRVPRTATVTAAEDGLVYALDCAAFLEAVTGHPHSIAAADRIVEERLSTAGG